MNILPKLFLLAALFCASSPALLANQVNSVVVPSAQVPSGQTATLTASVGYMGVQRSGQITFLVTRPDGTSSYHYADSPSGQISVVYSPTLGGVYTVKAKIDGMYQESYYNPQWYSFNPAWSPIASFSAAAGDTAAPAAPAMPTASNVTDTGFRVNWTKPYDNVGVTSYWFHVTRADGSGVANQAITSSASAVSADVTMLTQGTTYKVTVRARDAALNTSPHSPELVQQTVDTELPVTPATPTVSSVTGSSFIISWAKPSDNVGVVGYEIQRLNPDGSTTTSTLNTTEPSPSFTVSGLAQGTTYQVRVRAKDARPNWSNWSGYRSQRTLDTIAPNAPAVPSASSIAATSFAISWSRPYDNVAVTGYEIHRLNPDGTTHTYPILNTTATTPSFSVSGLTQGTTYQVRVRAKDATPNWSAWGGYRTQQTLDTQAPNAPGTPTASSVTDVSFVASWSKPSDNVGVTGYQVERLNPNGTSYAYPAFDSTAASLSFTVSGLTQGTVYQARVRAKDAAGIWSAWSGYRSQQTLDTQPPNTPGLPTTSSVTATSFVANWTKPSDNVGVVGYEIQRRNPDGTLHTYPYIASTAANLSHLLDGLLPATTYGVRVRAKDAQGVWSEWGPEKSQQTLIPSSVGAPQLVGGSAYVGLSIQLRAQLLDKASATSGTLHFQSKVGSGSWVAAGSVALASLDANGYGTSNWTPSSSGACSVRAYFSGSIPGLPPHTAYSSELAVSVAIVPNPTAISLSLSPPDVMGVGESSTLTAALSPAYSSGGQLQFFKKAPGASSFETAPFDTKFINSGSTSVPFTPNAAGTWTFKIVCSGTVVVNGSSIAKTSEATFTKTAVVWPAPVVSTIAPEVLRGAWTGSPTTLRAQVSQAYASAGVITFEVQAPGSSTWSAVSGTIQGDRWASASWTPNVDGLWSLRAKCSGNVGAGGFTRAHASAYAILDSGVTVYRPNNPADTGAGMSLFVMGGTPASGKSSAIGVRWSFVSPTGGPDGPSWQFWRGKVILSARNPHTGAWTHVGTIDKDADQWFSLGWTASFNWSPPDAGYWILKASADVTMRYYVTGESGTWPVEGFHSYEIDQEPVYVIWQGAGQVSSICPPGDSDCDGIPDAAEIAAGLDPNDSTDSALDLDGDGYSNIFEYVSGRDMTTYDQTTTGLGNAVPAIWNQLVVPHPTATEAVGATAGELSVGKSGEANYSVPLWTTPGTAGMEPKLALVYSSQGGNGMLGQGWSLSGLSAITRGPQTMAVDGKVVGVDFTSTDRFYLDGQRLKNLSGGVYGAHGAEYRTELETFTKVVSYGSASGGPAYFKAWTKAGLIMEYGNTPESAQGAVGSPVVAWHLNRISDTAGNYMDIRYVDSVDTASAAPIGGGRVHYVTRIDYTGNAGAGVEPYASARFEYENRPDASSGYAHGLKLSSSKRLTAVKVFYGEERLRTYALAYDQEQGPAARSLLASLTETGADNLSLKPLVFTYSRPYSDGLAYTSAAPHYAPPVPLTRGEKTNGTGFVDLNGDGFPDFVYARVSSGATVSRAWINTPGGWVEDSSYALPHPLLDNDGNDYGGRFADFDGDGLVDYLFAHKSDNGTVQSYAFRNRGEGSGYKWQEVTQTWKLPSPAYIREDSENVHNARFLLDVNGDGRVDFVYNNGPGLMGAYLNTGSGWSANTTAYIPPFPYKFDSHAVFIDVNGDGLPDQVRRQNEGRDYSSVALNTGSGWNVVLDSGSETAYHKYLPPKPLSRYTASFTSNTLHVWGTEVVDINGDGLNDLLYYDLSGPNGGDSLAYLNTGDGWARESAYDSLIFLGDRGATRGTVVADFNGDGFPDVSRREAGARQTSYGTGRGWTPVSGTLGLVHDMDLAPGQTAESSGMQLVDVNGDGFVDQLWNQGNSSGSSVAAGAAVNASLPRNLLATVTNGFGVLARINYAPLTLRDNDGYVIYARNPAAGPLAADQSRAIGPMQVVESVVNDDGLGGEHRVSYSYEDLRVDRLRGSLGFRRVVHLDELTQMETATEYSQQWPTAGMPLTSETRYVGISPSRLLSKSETEYGHAARNGGASTFVYVANGSEASYDPGSSSATPLNDVVTIMEDYDEFGNVRKVRVDTGGGYVKTTISTYTDTVTPAAVEAAKSSWILGRLATAKVETEAPGAVMATRYSSFEYYPGTGLLHIERVVPADAADPHNVRRSIAYEYDAFGNVWKTTLEGAGIAAPRSSQTQYDEKGRFPIWSENALGHRSHESRNPRWGAPDSVTSANEQVSRFYYDGFGRLVREVHPDDDGNPAVDSIVSEIRRRWAGPGAPSGALYLVETEAKGAPPAIAFFDKYGRETYSYGLNGGQIDGLPRIVGSRVGYDMQGRAAFGYQPFYLGQQPELASVVEYDAFGRKKTVSIRDDVASLGTLVDQAKLPASVQQDLSKGWLDTSYAYAGYAATATIRLAGSAPGAIDQVSITTSDPQGNIVRVENNATAAAPKDRGRVDYAYDGFGNLLTTTVFNSDGSSHVTTLGYDEAGRKISMDDPDMGEWEYRHNAAGELVWQEDAKGQVATLRYDLLGRLYRRDAGSDMFAWFYDNAPRGSDGFWLGKLHLAGYGKRKIDVTPDVSIGKALQLHYTYDSLGRLESTKRVFRAWDGATPVDTIYTTTQQYDAHSRPWILTYPDGYQVRNEYSPFQFLRRIVVHGGLSGDAGESPVGTVLWQADSHDIRGVVNGEILGNGVSTDRAFDPVTGRLRIIHAGLGAGIGVMEHEYWHDALGNVVRRNDRANGLDERFAYDGLSRLTGRDVNAGALQEQYAYDALGNLSLKGAVSSYAYGESFEGAPAPGPRAATNAGGVRYRYDANGNLESRLDGSNRTNLFWTPFNMVNKMESGDNRSLFWYGADHERVVQLSVAEGMTHYVGANYEKEWDASGRASRKCYVFAPTGRVAVRVVEEQTGAAKIRYLHQDGLGSVYAVTDENGDIEERATYDPWGERIERFRAPGSEQATSRGFTDHEMLPEFGLIHMNGRIYDPRLGRFCSADPFVQDSRDAQSYNRYSYVQNNPVTHADPSGYFTVKQGLVVAVAVVVTAVVLVATAGTGAPATAGFWGQLGYALANASAGQFAAAAYAGGYWSGFAGSLLNGGNLGDAFKAGVTNGAISAATAFASAGIASYFNVLEPGFGRWLGRTAAHGAVGGASAGAQGGEFRHGFVSSFASTGFMHSSAGQALSNSSHIAVRIATAAVVGGTASRLGGGKFDSGAITSAFQQLFNGEATRSRDSSPLSAEAVKNYIETMKAKYPGETITLTADMVNAILIDDVITAIAEGFDLMSRKEYIAAIKGSKGDGSFYQWRNDTFEITGGGLGITGAFSGNDINYYYQGFVAAARDSSFSMKSIMGLRIQAYNVGEFVWGEDLKWSNGGRWNSRNLRQAKVGLKFANAGFDYYNRNK